METVEIPRTKIKDFLTSRLVKNLLQSDETTLFDILRYESIGGFEKMADNELIDNLIKAIPEFDLLEFIHGNEHNIVLSVKEEYRKTSDEILVDIHRIVQTKF